MGLERIKSSELLIRDLDMARFFLKYAIENSKYILKEDNDNVAIKEFNSRALDLEKELEYYYDLLKLELNVNTDKIEIRRNKKRKNKKRGWLIG